MRGTLCHCVDAHFSVPNYAPRSWGNSIFLFCFLSFSLHYFCGLNDFTSNLKQYTQSITFRDPQSPLLDFAWPGTGRISFYKQQCFWQCCKFNVVPERALLLADTDVSCAESWEMLWKWWFTRVWVAENFTTPVSGFTLTNMCTSQQLVCCQMFSPGHIAWAATSLLAHNSAVGGSDLVITAFVIYTLAHLWSSKVLVC